MKVIKAKFEEEKDEMQGLGRARIARFTNGPQCAHWAESRSEIETRGGAV